MKKVYHTTQLSLFPVCNQCNKDKTLNDFSPNVKMRYRIVPLCKECHNENERQRRASKPPKICIDCQCEIPANAYGKRCNTCKETHKKENAKKRAHTHYVNNLEKRTAQIKTYREAHSERYKEWNKEYKQRPEIKARENARQRAYNRTERRRAYNRAYLHRTRAGNPKWQAYDKARYPKRMEQHRAKMVERNATPEFKAYRRKYNATHPEQAQTYNTRRRMLYATSPEYAEQKKAGIKAWTTRNYPKVLEACRRREARKRNARISRVSYTAILERDGRFCYICNQAILPHHKLHFDHVVPLARHGSHTPENIKPTHGCCNTRKNARLISELTHFDRRGPDD